MSTVAITLHSEGLVKVKPLGYIGGGEIWQRYVDALRKANARYNATLKASVLDIEMVPTLEENLRLAGFPYVLDETVKQNLLKKSREAEHAVSQAKNRMKSVDEELSRRGLELKKYQRTGVIWLSENARALLGDEPGLGKTIQALIAIPEDSPAIVICPATMKGIWRNEIKKWRPDLVPAILEGRGSWRWPRAGEIVICNYEIMPDDLEQEAKPNIFWPDDLFKNNASQKTNVTLISDEAHVLKTPKTKRTERFRALSRKIREGGGRVWLLTGTPLLNRPPELWNVLNAADLAGKAFGTYPKFVRLFNGQSTGYGMEWGQPHPSVPEMLKLVMLRRERKTVLPELPVKTWRSIDVELDSHTRKQCDSVLDIISGLGFTMEAVVNEHNIAKLTHMSFDQIAALRAQLARSKIKTMLGLVETYEENEQPLVVFSAHRDPILQLGTRKGWGVIVGDTPPERRTEIVEAFQGGRLLGLAATIKAGGVGITLTRANEALFVDLEWTPALNKQAEDRICRIGQTRGVIINRMIADHAMDQHVIDVLAKKQALIENTVEAASV